MKTIVSIQDRNFIGDNCSCHGAKESKYISWNRQSVGDICFFTDLCLNQVDYVNCKRKIAWLMEPREYTPNIYNFVENNLNKFDYVLSYDENLLKKSSKVLKYFWGSCWVPNCQANVNKIKDISIIASTKRHLNGHKLRHEIISKYPNIDAYGKEYKNLPNGADGKFEALRDYKFSVVIENSKATNFFTEKLIDCLYSKTIPIYWGCPNIGEIFDKTSILSFNTINEFNEIVENINIGKIKYDTFLSSVEKNYNLCNNFMITEDWIFENYNFLFQE